MLRMSMHLLHVRDILGSAQKHTELTYRYMVNVKGLWPGPGPSSYAQLLSINYIAMFLSIAQKMRMHVSDCCIR